MRLAIYYGMPIAIDNYYSYWQGGAEASIIIIISMENYSVYVAIDSTCAFHIVLRRNR